MFEYVEIIENFVWNYLGVPIIVFLGILLTIQSGAFQVRHFPSVVKTFFRYFFIKTGNGGVHPLRAFFACVGGCVGVGNLVGICTAVQIGGPGALFWIWATALVGVTVKYAEVYLGIRYRVKNRKGGYDGGPMYFLPKVFRGRWIPLLVCFLLCVYGVEVYQFRVVTESVAENFGVNRMGVAAVLLTLVFIAGSGGVSRVGQISAYVIPLFVVLFIGMGAWVLFFNLSLLPHVIYEVATSAFSGYSLAGGFVGSALMATISQGVRRGCYTGDLGVGYASVIHSESETTMAEKQASLVMIEIFLDTFIICTMSVLLILVSGVWNQPMEAGMLVQSALEPYFPYMNWFMPFFLFLLGYSTINAYFCVGLKCADFISPKKGKYYFYLYALVALISSVFLDTKHTQSIMAIAGGLLLVINGIGIWRLRKELSFEVTEEIEKETVSETLIATL